ncbi:MAG: insulinase family protein [Bryobacterales bacterium]|nr:insulinase family protein [Bryobacterales bacterium]MBV9397435.1 insulinase family protein [Bryobacterales bacterium]
MKQRIAILSLAVACAFAQQASTAPQPGAPASQPRIPSYKEVKYPPLPQVKIPEPTEAVLSNGMRVFLLEDHELPLISGLATIHTGNLFDPADKKGLSEVMADVMRSGGTKSKTGDQLDEELENVAASVESGMDETSASMSFSSLKESSDTVLSIFKDVLTSPEFRQDKIDLTLQQLRSSIARRNDNAGSIPDRELAAILYGRDTPYGWQMEYSDLAHIKRDDLIAFYRRYYFPKNIILAVYGDFKTAEMKEKLDKLFADWTVEQAAVSAFPQVTAKPAPGLYFAEKDDVTQTFFSIGELGGTLRDPDYAALEVASHILGQGFSSRLVSEIRTRLGYAYSVAAVWSANYNHPGTFRIVGSTKSMSTVDTVQAVQKELEKIRTTEVTEQELKEAKDGVLNAFVFNFDSPAKTLDRLMRYEYFGYPRDFLLQYQKAIAAVTRADVLRVAKKHFIPENLAIVAVGNPKDFGKALSTLGKVNTIDLTIPEPKQESAPSSAGSKARGKALLERAAQAIGGADKLAAIKDSTQTLELALDPGMKIKQTTRYIPPNIFRQEQEIPPIGKIVAFTDGQTGWTATPQGVQNMTGDFLKQAQGELSRQWERLILSDDANAVSETVVQISEPGGQVATLEIDAATGLPNSVRYRQGPSDVVESFADWRDAGGGIKMPFKLTIQQDGRKLGEATVSGYQFNTGLKADDLSKKP